MSNKYIYFVLCQTTKRVKIGTAFDVQARLASLQTGSPTRLILIGSIEGGRDVELLLHRTCSQWRAHGEWFEYNAPVRDCIENLLVTEHGASIGAAGTPPSHQHRFPIGSRPSVDQL